MKGTKRKRLITLVLTAAIACSGSWMAAAGAFAENDNTINNTAGGNGVSSAPAENDEAGSGTAEDGEGPAPTEDDNASSVPTEDNDTSSVPVENDVISSAPQENEDPSSEPSEESEISSPAGPESLVAATMEAPAHDIEALIELMQYLKNESVQIQKLGKTDPLSALDRIDSWRLEKAAYDELRNAAQDSELGSLENEAETLDQLYSDIFEKIAGMRAVTFQYQDGKLVKLLSNPQNPESQLQADAAADLDFVLSGELDQVVFDGVGDSEDGLNRFTLSDLSVSAAGGPAVSVVHGADVVLILDGEVSLTGAAEFAGIYVEEGSTLTIEGTDGDTLTVTGGSEAAGIGGNKDTPVGTIAINGGCITVTGGNMGAGIGSGHDTSTDGVLLNTGSISITGGTITATGGKGGAGIGSGDNGNEESDGPYSRGASFNNGSITITGGIVEAHGTGSAAGIGGGNHKSGGTITIEGDADVAAVGDGGAGIGCGVASSKDKMLDNDGENVQVDGGIITIGGEATVTANGSENAAGIGGGLYGFGGSVTITDSADVTATGGRRGAGIGGGYQGDGGEITISDNAVVKAYGKTGKDGNAKCGGAGIGGGAEGGLTSDSGEKYTRGGNAGTIVIEGGADVLAIGGWGAAGIGSGSELRESDKNVGYEIRSEQGSITVENSAAVKAFSDGTKWAVDLVYADVTSGLNQNNVMLQGRFRANDVEAGLTYTDKEKLVVDNIILDWDSGTDTPECPVHTGGTNLLSVTGPNQNAADAKPLGAMPVNYRSFAMTGFQSGENYDLWLQSGTYGETSKRISGVTVGGGRSAEETAAVTADDSRTVQYLSTGLRSDDDLAFTLKEPAEPVIPGPDVPDPKPDDPYTPPYTPSPRPEPSVPAEEIPEETTPLAAPDEIEEIGDEQPPLASSAETADFTGEEIFDEDIPLAAAPKTGAARSAAAAAGLAALLGAVLTFFHRKK